MWIMAEARKISACDVTNLSGTVSIKQMMFGMDQLRGKMANPS